MSWFEVDGFRLRTAEPTDVDVFYGYLNHADMVEDRQFGDPIAWPLSKAEIAKEIEGSNTGRTLVIEAGGEVVGHAAVDWWWDALQPWCGLGIAPHHRGNGHGRRAAGMLLEYLFDATSAHVVTTEVGEWNPAGVAFAADVGFVQAGRFRRAARREGRWQDILTFDLLRSEWEVLRAAR